MKFKWCVFCSLDVVGIESEVFVQKKFGSGGSRVEKIKSKTEKAKETNHKERSLTKRKKTEKKDGGKKVHKGISSLWGLSGAIEF